ncbi:MAG: hypothetical protein JW881_21740 [Spirochaetales bacterium]|nr:hypothetical protein [Spirochaetales bacterium]
MVTEKDVKPDRSRIAVIADTAFWASGPGYYRGLAKRITRYSKRSGRSGLFDRILFGSDFFLCLLKDRSNNHYLKTLSRFGEADPTVMMKLGHDNPKRFLFG